MAVIASAALLLVVSAAASAETPPKHQSVCASVLQTKGKVGRPRDAVAWRAEIVTRKALFYRLPGPALKPSRWLGPAGASWLLVTARPRVDQGRCWLQVRLPWRPNNATAWMNADNVPLRSTPWRIVVSTAGRTLTLFRAGKKVRTISVVVGKPSTPTPTGLFAIWQPIRWHPNDFLGSWVLELTAHSNVLRTFDGGDGTVAIHGRGGTSLLDPLGSAASHGCVRLANTDIDWLVHEIGVSQLPGTPVQIP